jgi:hypothetical protein
MWRSDLLFMAQEHNRDLVQQAEADRLIFHLNGTLTARFRNWWTQLQVRRSADTPKAAAESSREFVRQATDHDQLSPAYGNVNPVNG